MIVAGESVDFLAAGVDDDDEDDVAKPPPKRECMLYELYSLVGAVEEVVLVADFGVFTLCALKLIDLLLAVEVDDDEAIFELFPAMDVFMVLLLPLARLRLPPAAPVTLSSNETFSNSRNIRLRGDTCC